MIFRDRLNVLPHKHRFYTMRITPIILMFLYSTVLAHVKHVPLELIVKIQTPVRWSVAGGQDLTGIDGFDSIIQDMPGTVCR